MSVLVVAAGGGYLLGLTRGARPPATSLLRDNEEVRQLHDEDQADRSEADGRLVDWLVVEPRDLARRKRVTLLFSQGQLKTANDYYHAAMIFQHGPKPEDTLLAHELCVVAIILGKNDKDTRWLAASAEDRFLMNIDRPQRFGTQFSSDGLGPLTLHRVDPTLTDELRRLMGTSSLAEAMAREAELSKHVTPIYSKVDVDVSPPVEIERPMPRWDASTGRTSNTEYRGLIEVVVGEHGSLNYVTLVRPTVEAYDHVLLPAIATNWRFKPAMRNGLPVKYRTTFEVTLR